MKREFFDAIIEEMRVKRDIFFLSVGLGWPRINELAKKYPDRFIQCEASEQTALDIAVGLAYSGKIPFVYTITPFLLRGFETIRTYINHENLNVKLIGAGRGRDYGKTDGFSHDACDIGDILDTQRNIIQHYPETEKMMIESIDKILKHNGPDFLSLKR